MKNTLRNLEKNYQKIQSFRKVFSLTVRIIREGEEKENVKREERSKVIEIEVKG
jgi:hypothetical protein